MKKQTKILSICNSKGGVGKSVVTMMMATALAEQKNKKVLVIDCDSQATVYETAERAGHAGISGRGRGMQKL